jgi:hypothetical protein
LIFVIFLFQTSNLLAQVDLHLFTWEKSVYLLTLPRFEKIQKLEAEIIFILWKFSKTRNQRNFNFENFREGISKTQHQGSFNNFKNPKPPQNQRTAQHWFLKIPRVSKIEFQIRTEEQGRRKTKHTREIDQKQRRETNKGRTKMKSNKTS